MNLLSDFHRVCAAVKVPYYLEGGTLLGIVRDKQLLPWDNDIDVTVFTQSMTQQKWKTFIDALRSDGFTPFRINTFEFSLHKYDEYVDIHYSHQANEFNGAITTISAPQEMNIPGKVDKYLTIKYGNWRVVKKGPGAHSWVIPGA